VPEEIRRWCDIVDKYSEQEGLDPAFVAAVMSVESGGNPTARSYCDATGLMQIMPRDLTPRTLSCGALSCSGGPCFSDRPTIAELEDPETNVLWGTKILGNYFRHYGSYEAAAYHYNSGGGQAYINAVMTKYLEFSK